MSDTATAVLDPVKADTNDRRTPRWFFDQCEQRYGEFEIDAAASVENRCCLYFFGHDGTEFRDALEHEWHGQAWCNPPYGPGGTIEKWIAKARRERDERGTRTLMLLPADTSTKWYHDVSRTELCELVPFRLSFEAPDGSTKGNSAKFGSVLVWIAPKIAQPKAARRRKVAFLADASPKSSAFMNNLGALRSAGLIDYPQQGVVGLTDAGRRLAQQQDDLPTTSAELQEAIYRKLPQPQARIVRAVVEVYPHALHRTSVAERAEASPASSAFMNNLGALRSLGLIDYPQQGMVKAEPLLFLER